MYNEPEIVSSSNSSTQGSGSDSSISEDLTKAQDGVENTDINGYKVLSTNESFEQHDEGLIIFVSSIPASHVKEDKSIRAQLQPSHESTFEPHVKSTDTISMTLKEAGRHGQNGRKYEV